jgi:hypothetical protein
MYRWSKLQFVCNPARLNEIIIYRIPSLKYALQFRSWGIKLFEIQKMLPWTQFGLKTAFTIDYYWNKIILCFTFLRFFRLGFGSNINWQALDETLTQKRWELLDSGKNLRTEKWRNIIFWHRFITTFFILYHSIVVSYINWFIFSFNSATNLKC